MRGGSWQSEISCSESRIRPWVPWTSRRASLERRADSESRFLDRTGNQNGIYDLGDFRAFLVRNPDLPMNSELLEIMRTFIQLGPVAPPRPGTEEVIR